MKNFEISVSGKTLDDIILAIDEAKRQIEEGYHSGMNSNDDGEYSFSSDGDYEEKNEDDDE